MVHYQSPWLKAPTPVRLMRVIIEEDETCSAAHDEESGCAQCVARKHHAHARMHTVDNNIKALNESRENRKGERTAICLYLACFLLAALLLAAVVARAQETETDDTTHANSAVFDTAREIVDAVHATIAQLEAWWNGATQPTHTRQVL